MIDVTWQDLEEIKSLKSQYFYWLDMKQWDRLSLVFADGIKFEGFPFAMENAQAWVDGVRGFLAGAVTQHRGSMPRFRQTADDRVRGTWAMTDYLTWEPGSRTYRGISVPGMYGVHGYGYYEEEYLRVSGGWRISFMRLTRVRIDPLVGTPGPSPAYDLLEPAIDWLESC